MRVRVLLFKNVLTALKALQPLQFGEAFFARMVVFVSRVGQ